MQYRALGRTGLRVSEIGFGCGSQGGLMVRGDRADQIKAVARAVELGINYFDTAASYGDGESERNLGAVLRELRPDVRVGTKAHIPPEEHGDLKGAVIRSVEGSLSRLGRESVDLIQLHDRVALQRRGSMLSPEDVLEGVLEGFQTLQAQGKVRFYGMTGMGETDAVLRVVNSGAVYSVQTVYNLLNPSAGADVPPDFYAQDFDHLLDRAAERGLGAIVIRVLAAGAIAGGDKHPLASRGGAPMGTSADYNQDEEKAARFHFLVEEGYVGSPVEAALRFALANPVVSTVLVGYSSLDQVGEAVACAEKGPLPSAALRRLEEVWASFVG